jgi:hypothetical protein
MSFAGCLLVVYHSLQSFLPTKYLHNSIQNESNSMVQGIAENVMNANYLAQIHLKMGADSY